MINSKALLKRSRSTFAFDMSIFEEASQQVEESIAFPSIEWNFSDDDDDSSSTDEEDVCVVEGVVCALLIKEEEGAVRLVLKAGGGVTRLDVDGGLEHEARLDIPACAAPLEEDEPLIGRGGWSKPHASRCAIAARALWHIDPLPGVGAEVSLHRGGAVGG